MTSHLSFAVAQSRQQDMLRHAQEARLAAAVRAESRRSRARLPLLRLRLAGGPASAQATAIKI